MKKSYAGYIFIVLSALIFSTMEVMLKTVAGVFKPMQITTIRFFIGGTLLIPFALRSLKQKGARLRVKDLPFFALTGFLCVSFSMIFYQMAVTYTQASVVAVIFSSNTIFTTILAAMILKEDVRANHYLALVLQVLAIVIIINPFNTRVNITGVLLAILAAVSFALYGVVGKKRAPIYGGIVVTCLSFLFGSLLLMLILLLGRTAAIGGLFHSLGLDIFVNIPLFRGIPGSALPALLYISVVVSAGGFVCHMLAIEKTSAREAGLIFFLKPMIAPVIALIFLKEEIALNMLLGIICFVIGSGISLIPDLIRQKKAEKKG